MHLLNTYMKTYTALIQALVGNSTRTLSTEVRAASAHDARWLLQAVYGFHAVVSYPSLVKEDMKINELISTPSPEQQRLNSLKASKEQAANALKIERDRQKRSKALKSLASINNSSYNNSLKF